jgi:hypothetical protein
VALNVEHTENILSKKLTFSTVSLFLLWITLRSLTQKYAAPRSDVLSLEKTKIERQGWDIVCGFVMLPQHS